MSQDYLSERDNLARTLPSADTAAGSAAQPAASATAPSLRLVGAPPPLTPDIDTAPLRVPSSTFERHRLVATGERRLELARTARERAFAAMFPLAGLGLVALGLARFGSAADASPAALWVPLALGLVLVALGVALSRLDGGLVLDGERAELRRHGGGVFRSRRGITERVPFDDVVAVQRLAHEMGGDGVSWTVQQINLVRRDGSRVHLCTHADAALAEHSAERVARFVGVRVLVDPAEGGDAASATGNADGS